MPGTTSIKQHEELYNKIITFYDVAEELIDTIENDSTKDPEKQLDFIEPIVEEIEDATDTLAEEYRTFIKTGKKPSTNSKKRIDEAILKMYQAFQKCKTES